MKKQLTTIIGAVIDPATNRLCATVGDLARAHNLAPAQISRIPATRYQNGRYLDVEEVLEYRRTVRRPGRPRNLQKGSVETPEREKP
jgi:hypothetical protein